MDPLARLRLRLTGWYVGTFAAILLAFGLGLFFVVSRQIGAKLDDSLRQAVTEVRRNIDWHSGTLPPNQRTARAVITETVRELRIPDRTLYVLDADARPFAPDSASSWVRRAAQRAGSDAPPAVSKADIGREHTLRLAAQRFELFGQPFIAVATANTEELEDEYAALIGALVTMLLGALALVAAGGVFLARKSSTPVAQSFAQMRRFVADAAHELRTPVAVMRAQLDVALEHSREPAADLSTLQDVRSEAERLSAIVDDLFTLVRADTEAHALGVPAAKAECYLDDIMADVVVTAQPLAAQRGVVLAMTDFQEAMLVGDSALLRQLLMILLDNALKYTPTGGRVTLGVGAHHSSIVVTVTDTGMGIASDVLPQVFERFYRGEVARSMATGAGLGLSIARWIVEVHGGTIEMESEVGTGTTVHVTLPAVPS
jgi:signal transduction histidine kinase